MKDFVIHYSTGYEGGEKDGNGIVIGDLFITAAHVVSKSKSFHIYINREMITLQIADAIALVDESESIREDGMFYDFAIFKLSKKYNDFVLAKSLPSIGDTLTSYSYKHVVINTNTNSNSIFECETCEDYEQYTSAATVIDTIGNFIICEMSIALEEGRSGSPLLSDGNLYGILHGGVNGSPCIYQSIASILSYVDKNNISLC